MEKNMNIKESTQELRNNILENRNKIETAISNLKGYKKILNQIDISSSMSDNWCKPVYDLLTAKEKQEYKDWANKNHFGAVNSSKYTLKQRQINQINYLLKVLQKGNVKTPNWNSTKEDEVKSMCSYIRENRENFKVDNKGVYTGNVPQGIFKYKSGFVKHMKNGHHRIFGRELWINGNLHSIGGHLHLLDRALSYKKRGRKSTKKISNINDFFER